MDTGDRCDRAECGAQALVRAEFTTGPLFFCGHHWREVAYRARLEAVFVDEQDVASLAEQERTSSDECVH